MDFKNETKNIFEEFKKSGFKSNHELVTDSMLNHFVYVVLQKNVKNNLKIL